MHRVGVWCQHSVPPISAAHLGACRQSGTQESIDAFASEPVAVAGLFDFVAVCFGEGVELFGGLAGFLDGVGDGAVGVE